MRSVTSRPRPNPWAKAVLPSDYLEVRLTYGDDGEPGGSADDLRRIALRPVGTAWARRQVSLLHAIAPWADAPGDGVGG